MLPPRRIALLLLAATVAGATTLHAQSQAINGTIEGVVRDGTGAVLPGASVNVSNLDTGQQRTMTTNADGGYRAVLLSLGSYRVKAELQGFKTIERTGITLSAGQTAVVNFAMEVGGVAEVVSVTGEAPVSEPGKIDLGRTIGEAEIRNLPLVSRNPYNFAFLQANVTGYENEEFGVPRINANGTQMHTNYLIDGNTNTEKDRAGLRLLPASEIMVREVKLITSGFAPEFGHTTGMVYNAVTPSGSNDFRGSASYRFRRKGMSDRPFFLSPTANKPDTHVNNYTATLGGPIVKDKWFFYGGYEFVDRDLSADRVIGVTAANASRLGLSTTAVPAAGVIPASQSVNFFLGKTDYQLAPEHKLSARYFFFKNESPFNIGSTSSGNPNTVEQATDFHDRMDSASAQLISSFGSSRLNELRFQFARRHQSRTASDGAGTGPAVFVSGVANFGGPVATVSDAGFDFSQKIWQVIDNFTVLRGRHSFKVGGDFQYVDDSAGTTCSSSIRSPPWTRTCPPRAARPRAAIRRSSSSSAIPRSPTTRRSCPSSCRTTCASTTVSRSSSGCVMTSSRSPTRGPSPPTPPRRSSRSTRTTSLRGPASPGASTRARAPCCARPAGSCTSRRSSTSTRTRSSATVTRAR